MYSSQPQGKADKGFVQFKTTKGPLQIVFSSGTSERPHAQRSGMRRDRRFLMGDWIESPIS